MTMTLSRTCLLVITIHLISSIASQEVVKRVPQGFVGMRGKKVLDSQQIEHLFKRKPSFFVGVKGKKGLFEEKPELYYKRTPMGFVGMRGKKDLPDMYYEDNYVFGPKREGSLIGEIDYRADGTKPDEFPALNELLTQYLRSLEHAETNDLADSSQSDQFTNEIKKRAANMHQFFGVRGKKSIQNKRPYDLTFRGKFIGVRGKKDLKNSDGQEIGVFLDEQPWAKRKGQMGFIGMRGKKLSDESGLDMDTPN